MEVVGLLAGYEIGYACGDMTRLIEDIQLIKPHVSGWDHMRCTPADARFSLRRRWLLYLEYSIDSTKSSRYVRWLNRAEDPANLRLTGRYDRWSWCERRSIASRFQQRYCSAGSRRTQSAWTAQHLRQASVPKSARSIRWKAEVPIERFRTYLA